MPYKDIETKRELDRFKARRRGLASLRSRGLEPLDLSDPRSQVSCAVCGRVSSRHANNQHRHYEGCYYE